jgi:hypothetical protein
MCYLNRTYHVLPTQFSTRIDNYPIRQANYRIRWEALLASAWGGSQARITVQAV